MSVASPSLGLTFNDPKTGISQAPTRSAATTSAEALPTGDVAATKALFADFEKQKKFTKWNAAMPFAAQALASNENLSKGFIIRDPMPLTGYVPANASNNEKPGQSKPDTSPGAKDKNALDNLFNKTGSNPDDPLAATGFRFLFNPTSVTEGFSNTSSVDPLTYMTALSKQDAPIISMASGASMNLNLTLSRIDDQHILRTPGIDYSAQYPGGLTESDRQSILTRGTMYDIEHIFRLTNGKQFPMWWMDGGKPSADWGALLPRPVVVSIGDGPNVRMIRGIISSVSFSHEQFAPGMIPVRTTLTLGIERLLDNLNKGVSWQVDGADTSAVNTPTTPNNQQNTPTRTSTQTAPRNQSGYPSVQFPNRTNVVVAAWHWLFG